jgi:hypothetical protein
MRAAIAVSLLLLLSTTSACRTSGARHAGPSPADTAELDALWALAPRGAVGGGVVSPRGIAMLEGVFGSLQAMVNTAPDLPEHKRRLDEMLSKLGGRWMSLAERGFAKDGGAALFFVGNDPIVVFSLADRDRFLAQFRGTKGPVTDQVGAFVCKPLTGKRYTCGTSAEALGALGGGDLKARLAAVGARGDIEVAFAHPVLEVGAVAQLERGAATFRGAAKLKFGQDVLARFETPFARPRLAADRPTGFVLANLTKLFQDVPPLPLAGTTLDAVARSLDGPITVSTSSGSLGFDARQALTDPAPIRALLERCGELAPAAVQATSAAGACKITIPVVQLEIEASVTDRTLRIATRPTPGKPVPMTALGSELAAGEWTMAAWGRGTIFGFDQPGLHAMIKDMPPPSERELALARAVAMVHELGLGVRLDGDTVRFVLGVRTAFANPDVLVARLNALSTRQLFDGTATESMKRIAASRPKAPLAADLEAGAGGHAAFGAALAVLGAAVVPLFLGDKKEEESGPDVPSPETPGTDPDDPPPPESN